MVQRSTAQNGLPAVRAGFIRKVYCILSAQLAFTMVVSATVVMNDFLRELLVNLVLQRFWMLTIANFVTLGLLWKNKDTVPTNYYLLSGFTLLNSLSVSFVISVVHEELREAGDGMILQAACITLVAFLGLTAYTLKSDQNFSVMGAFLGMGLWIKLVAGVAFWFFDVSAWNAFVSWAGALLFSSYIIYDTWQLSKVYGADDYIAATIELYLDIVNLFINVLKILVKTSGKKK